MVIPFHIQEIAKLYPVIKSTENNIADGRVENWSNLISDKIELPKPGAYLKLNSYVYLNFKTEVIEEVWVYLGGSYFKQICKIHTETWKPLVLDLSGKL